MPVIRGKKAKFSFSPKFENIGDIVIEPNLDIYSEDFTRCDIVDGYHRSLGIMRYIESYKEKHGQDSVIKKRIPVQLTRLTVEVASEMVAQTFKRNDIKDTLFLYKLHIVFLVVSELYHLLIKLFLLISNLLCLLSISLISSKLKFS